MGGSNYSSYVYDAKVASAKTSKKKGFLAMTTM